MPGASQSEQDERLPWKPGSLCSKLEPKRSESNVHMCRTEQTVEPEDKAIISNQCQFPDHDGAFEIMKNVFVYRKHVQK